MLKLIVVLATGLGVQQDSFPDSTLHAHLYFTPNKPFAVPSQLLETAVT